MHPDRFSFLAYKHKQFRAVVARDVRTDGTSCTLECGHVSVIAPHFDVSKTEQLGCYECGKTYVRSAPQYAKEFQESA
jgi:ribosomal protein S27AE